MTNMKTLVTHSQLMLELLLLFFCSLTAITSLQVAVHLVNATDLDQVLFSVMSRVSVSAKTTLLARSVTCVSGDSLVFLMPPVKVRDSLVYRGFHITFDERVPKFVRNFRSSLLTWQFHYVVVNQILNFEAKL